MTIGTTVTIILGPEGTVNPDIVFSGSAIVTSIGHKVTHNGMVESSIKVKGTGALSIAAA
jgi:predicted secreted protein